VRLHAERVWLRAECDFLKEEQRLSYSTDGVRFSPLGGAFVTAYQLITFQGVRYSLFAFNRNGSEGGFADFDSMTVDEPDPRGVKPIPHGRRIVLASIPGGSPAHLLSTPVRIIDRSLGRVSLERAGKRLTVQDDEQALFAAKIDGPRQIFQWMETMETLTGEIVLMSLQTNRYLRVRAPDGTLVADSPGPTPDAKDGTRFVTIPAE
jgi:xylan 1,4-beta-xylosidase